MLHPVIKGWICGGSKEEGSSQAPRQRTAKGLGTAAYSTSSTKPSLRSPDPDLVGSEVLICLPPGRCIGCSNVKVKAGQDAGTPHPASSSEGTPAQPSHGTSEYRLGCRSEAVQQPSQPRQDRGVVSIHSVHCFLPACSHSPHIPAGTRRR